MNWNGLSPWFAGIVLGVYILGIVYALITPPRQHDPQRGVAIGCLGFVLVGLLALAATLAMGVLRNKPVLVNVISGLCLYSLAIVVIGLVKSGFDWLRNRQ